MEKRCPYCMGLLPPGDGLCPHCKKNPAVYQPPANQLPPGTVLEGRYQLGRALGQGGFGITYLAWDSRLDRRVAVKEYYPISLVWRDAAPRLDVKCTTAENESHYQKFKNGFLQEARTLSHMGNIPGIVQVHDFFEAHNTAYLVMEYLEGETFAQMVKRRGPLSMEELLKLLKPVFEALEAVHGAGIIHRDISPDNLMVLKNGAAKVMDFGAAREIDGERTMTAILRQGYAPPEQYSGHNQGAWTDVYALCAVIYYCLTRQTPPLSLERYDGNDPLRPPHTLGAAISGEQEAALLKGLAVRIDQRWQSASELRAALYPVSPVISAGAGETTIFLQGSGQVSAVRNRVQTPPLWFENVLMGDWYNNGDVYGYSFFPVFGSEIYRDKISSVMFLDTTANAPQEAWDVSEKKNRSVLAWVTKEGKCYHLFIAGNGGVAAPAVSKHLFAAYSNVEQIRFNGAFHTKFAMMDIHGMFWDCKNLKVLDLRGFDTSKVMDMSCMFYKCHYLGALDLRGFDTSKVTNMSSMFHDCGLSALDLSGFDTSKVTNMKAMFSDCGCLEVLDLSGFDTSKVTDMSLMFHDCRYLKTIYASERFATRQVTDGRWCFAGCTSLRGGNGTAYNDAYTDTEYARIDRPGQPGYFTAKR